jgi:hypothetical protein
MSTNLSKYFFIPIINSNRKKPCKNIQNAIKCILYNLLDNYTIDFHAYYDDIIPEIQYPNSMCYRCYDIDELSHPCFGSDCKVCERCERCLKHDHLDKMIWNNEVPYGSDERYAKKYINKFVNYIINQYDWSQYSKINSNLEKIIKEYTYDFKNVSVYIDIVENKRYKIVNRILYIDNRLYIDVISMIIYYI